MKAIRLHELGGPEKLIYEEISKPVPKDDQVIVRLKNAALNHRDVWIRKGLYAGIKLPVIPGSDGAGVIEEVGKNVDKKLIGKEVVINPSLDWGPDPRVQSVEYRILGLPDDGTYAEYVAIPVTNVHEKPRNLSFEEAAAIPLAALTAYRALVTRAGVQKGEKVLVTGIGGGVATFVLLIGKKLGAHVYVTSSSEDKIRKSIEYGAKGGFNYTDPRWSKEVVQACDGAGPDIIIDSAGGDTFGKAIDIVKPGGRIVTFGATTGATKEIEVRRIFWKQLNILGSTMGTTEEFTKALSLFSDGDLRPIIDRVYPLAECPAAHQRMESADQFGKIVISIS